VHRFRATTGWERDVFGYFGANADGYLSAGAEEEGCMWEQHKQCECDLTYLARA
jgi:hypothetical protein